MSNGQKRGTRKPAIASPAASGPLVFISHDSRDSEIAGAFAKLLASVSTGMLRSFRSSDTRTREGLDYGVEWFPEIESNLRDATDVVCLLTERSLSRPWILYEAGFARGRSSQASVFGLAIGIPLSKANTGPFALLQNCSDDSVSLFKLLRQLLQRLAAAEPQDEVIRSSIDQFMKKVKMIGEAALVEPLSVEKNAPDVGKIFEEIKAMFYDVSSEVKSGALNAYEADFLVRQASGKPHDPIGIAILASVLPPPLSWLRELSLDLYLRLEHGTLANPKDELKRLKYLLDISEPLLAESPHRRGVLQYFGRFVDHIAASYPDVTGAAVSHSPELADPDV